jgi:hypothetical protein
MMIFDDLCARTLNLTGHERLAVFRALPTERQAQAWRELAEWTSELVDHEFEVWRDR